ncbi:MAG: CRISPR-associated endonuclease Cas2 [Planctomyces sp.]|jgi:CRISPR-associated protein Cas2
MSQYVAAYDVSNDRQRQRVSRVLEEYGVRVQRSVYLVWLTPEEVPELRRAIGPLLAATDQFDVFPVDERGVRRRFSWQRGQENCAPVIVVDEWCEKSRIS